MNNHPLNEVGITIHLRFRKMRQEVGGSAEGGHPHSETMDSDLRIPCNFTTTVLGKSNKEGNLLESLL